MTYKKKFETIKHYYARNGCPTSSNSAVFRYLVDVVYTEIERLKNNKKEEEK